MAVGYTLLGIFMAGAAGAAASWLGMDLFAIIALYAGFGCAVLLAALAGALISERPNPNLPEDPILLPGE